MSARRQPWWRRSLRLRLIVVCSVLASLFMLALLPALRGAFVLVLEQSVEKRLASDAAALVSAARTENGEVLMPEKMPDEEFDTLEARLLGFIFDRQGTLVWRSRSAEDESIDYRPRYDGRGHEFLRMADPNGKEFFVYDVEVDLLRGQTTAFSVVTMQPTSDYQALHDGFLQQLYLWLGAALMVLLGLLWFGLTWGFGSLRRVSEELDDVESGARAQLSADHPRELLRLTDSLNRLLDSESRQRARYRHSLDDLAHSLKTPLSVLQALAEMLSRQPESREQARLLNQQIERMSQQIGYQLQRASLRRSGLVRHRADLGVLLDTLSAALDKVYRDKRVTLQRDFPVGLMVPMEQAALLELLGNLLENAYRLCLSQVRVSACLLAQTLELAIEDDGAGVPPPQRERILQRGERLDTQHPGQGIGTAVVLDILESYDGELSVGDSSLGGAEFRIRLPRI